uniref:Uncharacterized protein n=1 Tax=Vitis vinifera TaxID=29760 RepID=F6HS77_VITVI
MEWVQGCRDAGMVALEVSSAKIFFQSNQTLENG